MAPSPALQRPSAAMLDALSDPVIVIDLSGALCYANVAAEHFFGYSLRARSGRSVIDLVAVEDQQLALERIAATVTRPGLSSPLELRVVTADGSRRWVEIVTNNCLDQPDVNGLLISVRDVTERRAAEAARREADALFLAAFDDAPIGMAVVALDGRFLQVNAALCALIGHSSDDLCGMTFMDIAHPDDLQESLTEALELIAGTARSYSLEKRYVRADKQEVWLTVSVSLVRDDDGEPRYFVTQLLDTTTRRCAEDALRLESIHDPLTGLANRRGLDQVLDGQAARAPGLTIVSCDLDNMKDVNDLHGHPIGDALLVGVGDRLRRLVRSDDLVARVGGDEFVIVCPALSTDGAAGLVGRILAIVEEPLMVDDVEIVPRISVGIGRTDPSDTTTGDVVARADRAMYEHKRDRRERA